MSVIEPAECRPELRIEALSVEERCRSCGRAHDERDAAPRGLRVFFYLAACLGVTFAFAGAYVAGETLPRFSMVQATYRYDLPPLSRWVLASGWLQPLPGCFVTIASLWGVVRMRSGAGTAALVVVGLVASTLLLLIDWLGLLKPELVLV